MTALLEGLIQLGFVIVKDDGGPPDAGAGIVGTLAVDLRDGFTYSKQPWGWMRLVAPHTHHVVTH